MLSKLSSGGSLDTALGSALREAGVTTPAPLTQQERIWRWLFDHPRVTASAIARGLKMDDKNVSSLLSQMVSRGMIDCTKDLRQPAGLGPKRMMLIFWTLGKTYEVLPVKSKPRLVTLHTSPPAPAVIPMSGPQELPAPAPTPAPTPPPAPAEKVVEVRSFTITSDMDAEAIIDVMGVRQGRKLFDLLKEIYAG